MSWEINKKYTNTVLTNCNEALVFIYVVRSGKMTEGQRERERKKKKSERCNTPNVIILWDSMDDFL